MLTADSFLAEIDAFLRRAGVTATAFGKAAVGDPNFVGDLRAGRMPGLRTVQKVGDYIESEDRRRARAAAGADA